MKYTINELANSKGVSQPVREALLQMADYKQLYEQVCDCLLYTSPSPRDRQKSRMPSSA